jgi:hypothetical protein
MPPSRRHTVPQGRTQRPSRNRGWGDFFTPAQAVCRRGAAAIRRLRSVRAPFPSRAWTASVTVQNAGYSYPPFGAENSQPLPACAQVAPSRIEKEVT